MAWKGDPGRGEPDSSSSSSSAFTFVSLPLTPPGSHQHQPRQVGGIDQVVNSSAMFVSEKQRSQIVSAYPASVLSRATPRDAGRRCSSVVSSNAAAPHRDAKTTCLPRKSDGLLRRVLKPGNRVCLRLLVLIALNLAYSAAELLIGLVTRRIGLVSDAFHLSFGCGVLTFSLFAMIWSDLPADKAYTYGHRRIEVLAAFTNALFLLFLAFSLAVEALHAFVQDESEHKHYLIISAVLNLLVNLLGVWFFRNYARIHFAYRRAQDMNLHSICLHVLSDSFRSAGVILASWLLSLGVTYAETICLGLVSATVFYTAFPVFRASGGILSQMAPSGTSAAALNKCLRQVRMLDGVVQCYNARFWDYVPGFIVGTLFMQVREGADEQSILRTVHGIYNDIGVKDLTVEIETYK